MKNLLYLILRLLRLLGSRGAGNLCYSLDSVRYLREQGATIGERCRIYTSFIGTECYLLTIGDHVSIGTGVQLITHDGAVWVLREIVNNQGLDRFAPIKIGNNVFIGNDSIILPDAVIGDNVIVGANSVVTKALPSSAVYGGIPARRICDINEYKRKHISSCINTKTLSWREKRKMVLEVLSERIHE